MITKGKRFEVFRSDVVNKDFYNFYISDTLKVVRKQGKKIDKTNPYYLEYSKFAAIIKDFNVGIFNLLLYNSFVFKMPFNLGEISIRKKKVEPYINKEGKMVNLLPIDYRQTKLLQDKDPEAREKDLKVYHTNDHSNGYVAKLYYDKPSSIIFPNKKLYRVQATRDMKVALNKIMTSNFKEYDFFTISKHLM